METASDDRADHRIANQDVVPKENEILFTYEFLYETLRKEKDRFEIQKLPDAFYADSVGYLREKHAMLEDTKHKMDIFSADERLKLQTQIHSARQVLREIYERREKKIIDMSLNKSKTGSAIIDTTNLLPEERVLHDGVLASLDDNRAKIIHNVLSLTIPPVIATIHVEIPAKKTRHIKFTQHIDPLVGPNLETYGPFEQNDAAYLPHDIADILIAQGSAIALDG